ncbi:hypothetical protein EDI_168420 [Entamoeba dispar SAW760]|uniref:Uncharacterized protein n=1 Tax=Entamoeba dispar (strain ATCC PRA-260 / SAW760) TaxID=370354 RepID=B0E9E8_ENTDS|nr:uncharacterized protein EDI_168420 [Entamoeba dispar SAW760]EDR28857.1 hypothetical protein EDI_168420 [Entamoeba dispar SAW760]|eukprot:EDR28857.1 hypothetical protein EDI_168420 [Entamoeba dispar SAW760]
MEKIKKQAQKLILLTSTTLEQKCKLKTEYEREFEKIKNEQKRLLKELEIAFELKKKTQEIKQLNEQIGTKVLQEIEIKQQRIIEITQIYSNKQLEYKDLLLEINKIQGELKVQHSILQSLNEKEESINQDETKTNISFFYRQKEPKQMIKIDDFLNKDNTPEIHVLKETFGEQMLYKGLGYYNDKAALLEKTGIVPYIKSGSHFIALVTRIPAKIPLIKKVAKPIYNGAKGLETGAFTIENRESVNEWVMRYSEMFDSAVEQNGMIRTLASTIKNSTIRVCEDIVFPTFIPFYDYFH